MCFNVSSEDVRGADAGANSVVCTSDDADENYFSVAPPDYLFQAKVPLAAVH